MSERRNRLIEEMGLGPVWVLRDRSRESVAAEPDGEAAPMDDGFGDAAVATAGGTSVKSRPPLAATPAAREPARPATRPAGQVRPGPAAPDLPALDDGERRGRIERMDWTMLKSAVADCSACGLASTRTQTVFGIGDELADWMLVGEAPGAEEDARGEPFVGQAGKLLDNMLFAMELDRHTNVYIANVLKCRPPGNRNPLPEEVARCSPHLERQVALVQPKLILAMGRFAAQTLLNSDASIANLRGKLHSYQGVPVIVTYHPAYLLRNLPDKAKAWEDLVFAMKTMAELKKAASGQAAKPV
jgi:uracil-DNA glycosylase family 4